MEAAWFALGTVCIALFWGVVIAVVVWAIRSQMGRQENRTETQDPIRIAESRYARGEITSEELEDIKNTLSR